MSRQSLPANPNLEHLRNEAKALLRAFRADHPDGRERFETDHPQHAKSPIPDVQLSDALWVVAREYGFESWVKLKEHVELGTHAFSTAVRADDLVAIERILRERPETLRYELAHRGDVFPLAAYVCRIGGSAEALALVVSLGADVHDLNRELFGMCEDHNLEGTRKLLAAGIDPNDVYNAGWDCHVLLGWVQTYLRDNPARLHEGVNLLIEHGAHVEDTPVWDIHRGDLDRLESRLRAAPDLARARVRLDYGNYITLRGVTLLHVAAEYNELAAAGLLLRHGADLDARAEVGRNGVGGQTPLFHVIGSNKGSAFTMFGYLMGLSPDLTAEAHLPSDWFCEDPVHKGEDHFPEDVRPFTPLAYAAHINENHPSWRDAAREESRLRAAGAPE